MPDYSFIANPQTSSGLQSLSSIMNTAATMQNIQRGGVALEQERALLQPNIERGIAQSKSAQTEALSKQFDLSGAQSSRAMQIAGGLIQDPRIAKSDPVGTIDAANEAYSQMVASGIPAQTADFWASQVKAKAHQPNGALQFLSNAVRANAGSGSQANVINAPLSQVTTPAGAMGFAQLQPGAPNAVPAATVGELNAAGGNIAPTVIQPGIQPSALETPATDVLGQPAIAVKDQRGNISYKAPPGANYKPVMSFPAGENAQTLPANQAMREQANALGASAPQQHFNNKQILDLSSDAFTGTGGGKLSAVLGAVGLQSTNNVSSDTAQLKHFIALQIEQNASAQGANTDAARRLSEQAVLPTDSPEKAIKNITKVNDAYVTGNELYNQGMEAAINNPNNQFGVFAARQFRNAWAQNFDPRITLLENAQKSGDTATIDRILGPKGSPQRAKAQKELLPKAQALRLLVQGGI